MHKTQIEEIATAYVKAKASNSSLFRRERLARLADEQIPRLLDEARAAEHLRDELAAAKPPRKKKEEFAAEIPPEK